MTPMQHEEYQALRATIRERGSLRVGLILAGIAVWAALTVGIATLDLPAWVTLAPLLVLSAAFEVVFALHVGVERVGRYLQVFYEEAAGEAGWEAQIMEFGRRFPGGGTDPLCCRIFWLATAVNLLPVFRTPRLIGCGLLGLAHVVFAGRVVKARQVAAGQRPIDLERFRQLKASASRDRQADEK
jgi:hypothetical protein